MKPIHKINLSTHFIHVDNNKYKDRSGQIIYKRKDNIQLYMYSIRYGHKCSENYTSELKYGMREIINNCKVGLGDTYA